MNRSTRLLPIVGLVVALVCCSGLPQQFDARFGESAVRDRDVASTGTAPEFHRDVKPIFDARCVVCHACYDAPCQLKLTSSEGVDRGASKEVVYDGSRLIAAKPNRLNIDARSTAEWRKRGFFPVLNERNQAPEVNRAAGVLYRMLELKRDHPLPTEPILPGSFDFALDRKQQCSVIEQFDEFADSFPQWGMPYGLPGVRDTEFQTIKRWIDAGAPSEPLAPVDAATAKRIAAWEAFFNGTSLKQRLAARYIYEHLFLADLYFSELGPGTFFRIVRSSTPPGQPIVDLATRRPFDPPGVEAFWYRLRRIDETTVDKTHMPYALNPERMATWTGLFLDADYSVSALPSYEPRVAANPFDAFRELPVRSRYRFMLEEAQFTLMGFIKGPVCRGQVALDVINDHFWVVFVDPESEPIRELPVALEREVSDLRLPAEAQSNALPLTNWVKYSRLNRRYLDERAKFLAETFPDEEGPTLELIWNGDGHNRNAALTVFRHFDSATVLKGWVGGTPKTAWVVGYSLLERIHYLLVAGFDVYGNLGHQVMTRMYMDFLRMEGESSFVAFLPEDVAERELLSWYRGSEKSVGEYVNVIRSIGHRDSDIVFSTDDPKQELYAAIRHRLGPVVAGSDPIAGEVDRGVDSPRMSGLRRLATLRGRSLEHLPEQSILQVIGSAASGEETAVYTLLLNRAHTNVSSLFGEAERLRPDEYTVSVVPGIVGSYPNAFLRIRDHQLQAFAGSVEQLASEADYAALLDTYGVRRTSEGFWAFSDWLFGWYVENAPVEAGRLDYNRFENR